MTITLRAARLTFVRLASGTVHAQDSDLSDLTLCGRALPETASWLVTRAFSDDRVCARCTASLRTYTRSTPPKVRFAEPQQESEQP